MLQTLIVGLGRSGQGLHLPVVRRARALALRSSDPSAGGPIVAVDPRGGLHSPEGTILAPSLSHAAGMLDPGRTVVHVCTPPDTRVTVLDDLGRHGFKNILVEKPLALDEDDLAAIDGLCRHWNLRLLVVAPWLASALTHRLQRIVEAGELGALRAIYVIQRKPRFTRSLGPHGHPSAFDVELPHSVGVALALAGQAQLLDAAWSDLRFDNVVLLRMGGARVTLAHDRGVRTEIRSDLASPLRERRISLEFERASVVGHYPASEADHAAQLVITAGLRATRAVFHDDALLTLILDAYRRFAVAGDCEQDFEIHRDVVRLLSGAKRRCESAEAGQPSDAAASRPGDDHLVARRAG